MPAPARPLAFILASTDHGAMIVNRFDQHNVGEKSYGVGYQLLSKASYDPEEVSLLLKLLDLRRKHYGDGVVAVDCGANLGVHTVEWAKHMTGWGAVLALEAQERIYYALAGNLALNNCFNARAINAAVSRQSGTMKIPQPNYLENASFGSIELAKRENSEFVGQAIDYSEDKMAEVRMVHLDAFNFPRLDLLTTRWRRPVHRRAAADRACRDIEIRCQCAARLARKSGLFGLSGRTQFHSHPQRRQVPGEHHDQNAGRRLKSPDSARTCLVRAGGHVGRRTERALCPVGDAVRAVNSDCG